MLTSLFCMFSHVIIQRQTLRNRECCICRRTISKNEEIVVCPDCQTIYHRKHLSLWLKIRKKCPICKNIIRNCSQSFHFDMGDPYSSRNINISPNGLTSHQSGWKVHTRKSSLRGGFIALECPHCKNILELSTSGTTCHLCGSHISWINDLESCVKNLEDLTHFRTKKNKRGRSTRERYARKISYRKIEQEKQKKRKSFRNELQKQKQSESQEELFLLNQAYFGKKTNQLSHEKHVQVRLIEVGEMKKTPRKIILSSKSFVLIISVIVILILVIM